MSKVFNKKRIDSINNIKVKKYVLYAIGEILIVAVGIFLAIFFNNLKEEQSNKKYIGRVLNEVSAETKRYINNSIFFMNYNAKRDSLVYKILSSNVERDDYNLRGSTHLNVLQTMVEFEFDNTPLENLNRSFDFLSDDEKKVYDLLTVIKNNQEGYEIISENAAEILNEYKTFQKANHDWFYLIEEDSLATKKEFEYRLNSFEYKNFIKDYANYEIYHKSNSYTFLQIAAALVHYRVVSAQSPNKLNPLQVDSLMTNLGFKSIPRIDCDARATASEKPYELFKDISLYNFLLNGSQDTIQIRDEENVVRNTLVPKQFSTIQISNGTPLSVYVGDTCMGVYNTQINSYLYYE